MKVEALSLRHKALLSEPLKRVGGGLSEYSFSNLYLFRRRHDYRIIFGERLFLAGRTYDGGSCLTPLFDVSDVSPEWLVQKLEGFDFYFPLEQSALKNFDRRLFKIFHNPDDSDYIYSSLKLETYKGRKLAKKKNLMKQFSSRFSPEDCPLDRSGKADAEEILDQWREDKKQFRAEADYLPCLEAVSLVETLGLKAHIYYADRQPAGFVLAAELSPNSCAIHFAKGKRRFKGVFPYMFNHFANLHKGEYRWYNFEQDLGKPNFRQTKRSYNPDKRLIKYRVGLVRT